MTINRHADTFLTLRETAEDRRWSAPYQKTYDFPGDFIDVDHATLVKKVHPTGMIDLGIEGWLLPADALKLYEMAYFCQGDILELGTYKGLSSAIMSTACVSAKRNTVIVTVDLDPDLVRCARENLMERPGRERVHLFVAEGEQALKDQISAQRRYGFVFIDHSHRFEHVYAACNLLHDVVLTGGFALFHDFNDPRNPHPAAKDYGVHQGVTTGLLREKWEFWGIYGCTGLFRRVG
jgi:hypothetical protein